MPERSCSGQVPHPRRDVRKLSVALATAIEYERRPATERRIPMFLMLSKKPRRANRGKTNRYRAKLKAKNRTRRNRVYQR